APLPVGRDSIHVVVKNEKPAEPLSDAGRRTRSVENLEKIGRAISAYVAKYGRLPPQSLIGRDSRKTLSWRVAILPELGYQELYDQFKANEPWDGPHNKELLSQIPPEFQSPERFDTRTNYVAAAERGMIFDSQEGWTPAAVRDGLENTLAVVEADDGQA